MRQIFRIYRKKIHHSLCVWNFDLFEVNETELGIQVQTISVFTRESMRIWGSKIVLYNRKLERQQMKQWVDKTIIGLSSKNKKYLWIEQMNTLVVSIFRWSWRWRQERNIIQWWCAE